MRLTKSTFIIPVCCLLSFYSVSQNNKCPVIKPENISCDTPVKKNQFQIKDIVKDFGADPSGEKNSHIAFECAAYYFNMNGGNGKLIIPYGTYLVGQQGFAEPNEKNCVWIGYVGWLGKDLFRMSDCKNFTVQGMLSNSKKKPIIRFEDNMKLGGFTKEGTPSSYLYKPDGTRHVYPSDCKTSAEHNTYASNPGTLFWFEDCTSIQFSNIELDGNSEKYILGSYYGVGPAPYELWNYGIVIWNTKNISIKNTDIQNIGTDGILVKNYAETNEMKANDNILIENCNISYAGRNNLSWVGGRGLTLKNSSFNFAGKGQIKMDPGSGLDIEPESHELRNSRCSYVTENGRNKVVNDFCINGTIENCVFQDNRVSSFTNASADGRTLNCKVMNSKITSKETWSLTVINKNYIQFYDCLISGRWVIEQKVNKNINADTNFIRTKSTPPQ